MSDNNSRANQSPDPSGLIDRLDPDIISNLEAAKPLYEEKLGEPVTLEEVAEAEYGDALAEMLSGS